MQYTFIEFQKIASLKWTWSFLFQMALLTPVVTPANKKQRQKGPTIVLLDFLELSLLRVKGPMYVLSVRYKSSHTSHRFLPSFTHLLILVHWYLHINSCLGAILIYVTQG